MTLLMITAEPSWLVYAPDYRRLSEDMAGDQSGDSAYQIVDLTEAVTPKGQFVRQRPHTVLAAMKTHREPITFCGVLSTHTSKANFRG